MVLLVHGGPWGRDGYGYNGSHQWLANRGYAVLSVNFRASTGFGKEFITAGNLQWGRKMHDDLLDAIDWAVAQGVTTADKVAIMGGSYGGYATLAGLTMTPGQVRLRGGHRRPVEPGDLAQDDPALLGSRQCAVPKRMGDPTPRRAALLKERSPLYLADQIGGPLLIGQGANDPRVNVAESEQIVEAMKAKHPGHLRRLPRRGPWLRPAGEQPRLHAATEKFLAGASAAAPRRSATTLAASTAKAEEGAALVPGWGRGGK